MNKNHLIAVALLFVSGGALALNDSTSYAQLFQDTIINDAKVNGDLAKAEAYTDCHLTALGAFPEAVQNEIYNVASESNSYTDARAAFSKLVVLEMAAGEAQKAAITGMIEQAKLMGKVCMAGIES